MTCGPIPDEDHIARLCSFATLDEAGEVQASAFVLREKDSSLSVTWLECFDCVNREDKIIETRKVLSEKLNLKPSAKLAVLNVGETKSSVSMANGCAIKILHEPTGNPCHAGINDLPRNHDGMLVAEIICETIKNTYPAVV